MTCLVYGIYDISRRNTYIITVKSKEVAHELCLLEKNYAFKPVIVAEYVDEAKVLIRNEGGYDD